MTHQADQRGFDPVHVNPVAGIQRPAARFGPAIEQYTAYALQQQETPGTYGSASATDSELESDIDGDDSIASQAGDAIVPEEVVAAATEIFPRFARLRMNLTALSQVYNLYFVAYAGAIHVYTPENQPRILGRTPLLIVQPKRSAIATMSTGHVSLAAPHQINNMIVGQLGDQEVLVAAFDDGDVVAYYTHSMAEAIGHRARPPSTDTAAKAVSTLEPFLHRAVGKSAWGLAVHQRSRLIAVSSNLHEVTVFALALAKASDQQHEIRHDPESGEPPAIHGLGLNVEQLENHLRQRTRDWRIILHLREGHKSNIPSITFLDDENGEADKVVAVDILGNCWVLDIWALGAPCIRVPVRPDVCPETIGWGVMVLPDHIFQLTETIEQFTGMNVEDPEGSITPEGGIVIDLTRGMSKMAQNGRVSLMEAAPTLRRMQNHKQIPFQVPQLFADYTAEGLPGIRLDVQTDAIEEFCARQSRWGKIRRVTGVVFGRALANTKPLDINPATMQAAATIVPSSALVYQHDEMRPPTFLTEVVYNTTRTRYADCYYYGQKNPKSACLGYISKKVAERFSILRTTDVGIELYNLEKGKCSVICQRLLTKMPNPNPEPWDMMSSTRICMTHCIPELSLVVVGSCCGRVGLIRLTRTEKNPMHIRHGFRVEWVLPRPVDEEAGLRPNVWMVGMAVSRIPQPGAQGLHLFPVAPWASTGQDRVRGRGYFRSRRYNEVDRWRLLLHFMDHTILSYTIQASQGDSPEDPLELELQDW